VDQLLFVADPSARGLATARRLYDLALEMEIDAGLMSVVINRAINDHGLERARRLFDQTPVAVVGRLPEDAELSARDVDGEPIFTLPAANPVYMAAGEIFRQLTRPQSVLGEERM
jgi:CO dehydrogenase nickel-insertion accessory protein CooC1